MHPDRPRRKVFDASGRQIGTTEYVANVQRQDGNPSQVNMTNMSNLPLSQENAGDMMKDMELQMMGVSEGPPPKVRLFFPM